MGRVRSSDWHPQARMMRADGMKTQDIATALGKPYGTVNSAVRGVKCSIDHLQAYYDNGTSRATRRSDWVGRARAMRAQNMTYDEIARVIGLAKSTIQKYTSDVPASIVRRGPTPEARAQGLETKRLKRQQAIKDGLIPPRKPRKRSTYVPNQKPVLSRQERLRRQVRTIMVRDQSRPAAAITLPRLSFLET